MRTFESINIGEKAELVHVITEADLDQFVSLTGDNNRLHTDEDYARNTAFKKRVIHGMLGASFISAVIGTKLPGDGALWYAQSLDFLLPVRIGDTIRVVAEVVKKVSRLRTIELRTTIYNQDRQIVTSGTAKVKVVESRRANGERTTEESRKVALVIGGSGGIGRATCIQLARDGFAVAIHYHRNRKMAEETLAEVRALGQDGIVVSGDITDPTQVDELVWQAQRSLQTISVVVNCATARIPSINLKNLRWDDIQRSIDMEVRGAFNLQKSTVPSMEECGHGRLIFLTSHAIEKPNSEWLPYITGKSALHGFARSLAIALAPKGILVNLVSPGMTDTDLIADVPEKARLLTEAQTPLRRLARPDDVAGAISFLASDKSRFLTGETIRLNGGQVMI
ncbi:MAG: SDR family oxidoreductase [Candidatus Omnitrophica bacterium]|nr:SDR family oxidoreductase [Candidatus Omnitrophota bacterium]